MPISDHQMIESWREVLRLSNLEKGQIVTILCRDTSANLTDSENRCSVHGGDCQPIGSTARKW